jgi:SAM-dependent methyltransferase
MASNYRVQLESWLRQQEITADSVLDVGGAAKPVKNRVKRWFVNNYLILDSGLEKPADDINYQTFNLQNSDALGYTDTAELHQKFDIAFCLEVMEYIYDTKLAIRNIEYFLKPGGLLYITFPFIYPFHNPTGSDCTRYTLTGIKKLLDRNGLTMLGAVPRLMTNEGQKLWQQFVSVERMHPAKGEPHNILGWIVTARKNQ